MAQIRSDQSGEEKEVGKEQWSRAENRMWSFVNSQTDAKLFTLKNLSFQWQPHWNNIGYFTSILLESGIIFLK